MSEPRSVSEICKDISNSDHSFYIPDYQRGYRWDKEQAEDLLNDVKSFFDEHFKEYISGADVKERYFIQPLVVREDKKNKVYRVIDGQQRLTTFSLILLALNQLKDMNILDTSIVIPQRYDIEYENRPNSRDFLNKDIISNPNRRYDYLDFLHMFNVYDSV